MNATPRKLGDLVDALDAIAPPALAEPWDNVGLLVGDRSQPCTRAILTIDYTPAVAIEAREATCDAVIAYHPPLFDAVKRFTAHDRATELLFDCAKRGVGVYSPHTALDVADGGTNDVLADALGLVDRLPLRRRDVASKQAKLVTFAPPDAIDRVANALFDAGAGRIGDYSRCSFRSTGTGTFQGSDETNPTVGKAGAFERVEEIKIETIVPLAKLDDVIRALKKSHPYEEPAFDLQQLVAPPQIVGIGRVGKTPGDATAEMLANLLKRSLGLNHVLIAGDAQRLVRKVAVCAGAGGDLLNAAIAQKADVFVTGELRHHDALKAARAGMTVFCTLHSNSERATLPKLAERLRERVSGIEFVVSKEDRDPFVVG
jgi:dinuclear metal center YbgI/SA1388 family protein